MGRVTIRISLVASVVGGLALIAGPGCIGSASSGAASGDSTRPSAEQRRFPLENMQTAAVEINGHVFRVWLARTPDERTEGLMHVPENEIDDDQGMLFVFSDEQLLGFWMRDTITALDIAFARRNGRIVKTHTMPPLTLQTFPSIEPAMFALEVKAGTFEKLGIAEGDQIIIPEEVLKASP